LDVAGGALGIAGSARDEAVGTAETETLAFAARALVAVDDVTGADATAGPDAVAI